MLVRILSKVNDFVARQVLIDLRPTRNKKPLPTACARGGYLIPYRELQKIQKVSEQTKTHLNPEMAITGIFREKAELKIHDA